jgi:hypothetical protein
LLYGTLRETGFLRNLAMAQSYPFLALTDRAPPQKEVHDESGGAVIMAHQVAKEHVDNILVKAKGPHAPILLNTIAKCKHLDRPDAAVAFSGIRMEAGHDEAH